LRWHRRKVKQEMRATSIAFEIGGSSGDELLASIRGRAPMQFMRRTYVD
jgi:hypothetical protein